MALNADSRMAWACELTHLESHGVELAPGLSAAELSAAEERVGCRFPPDLRSFLGAALPSGTRWPDWRVPYSPFIADRLAWPTEGIEFDIRNNVFWWPAWGAQPDHLDQAVEVMREQIRGAPKLIPIFGHVYLPAAPEAAGNPVLSVYQTDIIYGGRNLGDYLRRFGNSEGWELPRCDEVRKIWFWSELIEWNGGCV
jgi:hypothetical protein